MVDNSDDKLNDLSILLDEPIHQLALAQMRSGVPVVTLTAFVNGDVIASIMKEPGGGSTPYARVNQLTRMLKLLRCDDAQDE